MDLTKQNQSPSTSHKVDPMQPHMPEQRIGVGECMDMELLVSFLLACLEHSLDDILGQHISHMEVTLSTPQVPDRLRNVEDPVSVHPRYGIEILFFMGGRYNHFSYPEQAMGVQLAS